MDNIYTVLEKLKQVTDRAVMEDKAAVDASKMNKQKNPLEKEFNYVNKKYKLLSDLGQGTYGKVLLAKHRDSK